MDKLTDARNNGTYGKAEADELPLIRHGSFKLAYNHEMIFLIIAAGIAAASLIVLLPVITLAAKMESSAIFEAVLAAVWGVFSIMCAVIFMGRGCEFSAEQNEFMLKGPGRKTEYFYYSDVSDITFEPFSLFGKHRGYIVTVTTSLRTTQYREIFGDNKVIRDVTATPFYYLGVNSGIITTEKPQLDSEEVDSMFESALIEQITAKAYRETENDGKSFGDTRWNR